MKPPERNKPPPAPPKAKPGRGGFDMRGQSMHTQFAIAGGASFHAGTASNEALAQHLKEPVQMPRTRPDEMRAIEHEFHNLRDLDRCYVVPDLQDVAKKRARVSRQKAQKAQRRAAAAKGAPTFLSACLRRPGRQALALAHVSGRQECRRSCASPENLRRSRAYGRIAAGQRNGTALKDRQTERSPAARRSGLVSSLPEFVFVSFAPFCGYLNCGITDEGIAR